MKVKVTNEGVIIPKKFFAGIREVEVKKENGLIMLVPTTTSDPIYELGKHPVECGFPNASEDHDKFLYDV